MWLSHTRPPCLSARWCVNTTAVDSVLALVFTERNKLLNLKPYILSSSRVILAMGDKCFLPGGFFWNDRLFDKDSLPLFVPTICFQRQAERSTLSLDCSKNVWEGKEWRARLNFPSKFRSYIWYLPYTYTAVRIPRAPAHAICITYQAWFR